MAEFRLEAVRSLARQMGFAPRGKRLDQLAAAEDLLLRVDADRQYAAEFLVHAVTGYRPKTDDASSLPGGDLQHDLGVLIERVSEAMALSAADAGEPVLRIEDVCRRFGVTSKTIQRWRRKGLPARRYGFDDGKTRVGFRLSCVERFVARQEGAADRPAGVEPLSESQRDECVRRARRLAQAGHGRDEVVRRVARRMGRSSLAVLHTLEHHDAASADPALSPAAEPPSADEATRLLDALDAGDTLKKAASKVGRPRAVAYRLLMERRAERVASATVRFHDDPLFHGDPAEAERQVRSLVRSAEESLSTEADAASRRVPRGLPPYLADLYRTPLLTPALERAVFLQFNFHKARFAALRAEHDPHLARRASLDRLERHLRLARAAKNRLVTANLRLVVSVARKHLRPGLDLMDLVSDGNIVLMRAVEGFDVARGFKFSTYATLALMKGFARSVPQMQAARPTGNGEAATERAGRRDAALIRLGDRDEVQTLLDRLDAPERRVISARFGLGQADDEASLDDLSRSMGLPKTRVRQIETAALTKLRRLTEPSAV